MAWANIPRAGIKKSKYGAKKASYDGIVFDSLKEMRRYKELSMLQKAGAITDLDMQVKYVLIPAQREPDKVWPKGGKIKGKLLEREVSYIADFVYREVQTGELVVEDAKGMRTKEYILKRKMMLYFYGIKIKEV